MPKFNFTREFYVPKDYAEIKREDGAGAVVYASACGLIAMGFSGKRQKPDFHIRFGTKERAEQYVSDWMDALIIRVQQKQAQREARKSAPNPLAVGDVLSSSWGYEQTNIDYYEVTAVVGLHTVEIREIGKNTESTEFMQGICVPCPGKFIGEPMRKRVNETGHVKITSFEWARKKEVRIIAGVRVFAPDSWTAYA